MARRLRRRRKTKEEPRTDFANGEILIRSLRLIGCGVRPGRLLIAAEVKQNRVRCITPAIQRARFFERRRLAGATPSKFRRWRNSLVVLPSLVGPEKRLHQRYDFLTRIVEDVVPGISKSVHLRGRKDLLPAPQKGVVETEVPIAPDHEFDPGIEPARVRLRSTSSRSGATPASGCPGRTH